jgi:WD40 repeat protein
MAIAYSPQGDQLASGSFDHTVRLWDVKSGECRRTLIGHKNDVNNVVYSPNGSQLVSCSDDSKVRVWDVETGTCVYILIGHSGIVRRVAYSPQNDSVASAGEDDTIRVWDVGTGGCKYTFLDHHIVAYSPSGGQIASGGGYGSVKVWDTESGDCLWIFVGHRDDISGIVYSPRGDLVVSASYDSSVRLWNVTSGECQAEIQDFQGRVTNVAWTEVYGVNYLVAGCDDGAVGTWQVLLDGGRCDISLRWMTSKGVLDVKDATIKDVQGLSQLNKELLKLRGAMGEPANRLREVGKKVTTMASVVSQLKTSSRNTAVEDPVFRAGDSIEQLEERLQLAKDLLFQDMVAAIIKNINLHE